MKKLYFTIVLLLVSFLVAGCNIDDTRIIDYKPEVSQVETTTAPFTAAEDVVTYEVLRVVDGDTIVIDLNGKETKVRMIGIDTPESVHNNDDKNCDYGTVASDYTKSLLTNQSVSLEYDVDEHDKYGRVLAYVYVDDTMVNYDLVINGYAVAKEYKPNTKYSNTLKEAQIDAQEEKVGMWSDNVSVEDCPLKDRYYIW